MSNNIQGVDLTTGKLLIPVQLASLSGPNNFGETLSLQYSTTGLLQQIKTWNEEAQTVEVGLGWSLSQQYIMRIGNGSLDDTFILNGEQASALILQSKTQDSSGLYTLVFVTAQQSLNKIVYETIPNDPSSPEKWTIVDANGITYIYGGNSNAISWGVCWVAPTTGINGQPLVWIGDSTATENQSNYALAWYLTSKENIYGQQVKYDYSLKSLNVGPNGTGKSYTMAAYLQSIKVSNGDSLTLSYADKAAWEYPTLRVITNSDSTITNAYQDRITTQYLQTVSIYNAAGNLQGTIQFDYDFLFQHLNLTANDTLNSMQKRVLTAITYLAPGGQPFAPGRLFDYWGLNDKTQGLNITNSNLLTLVDSDLTGTFSYTDNHQQQHSYTALFGHLKTQTISNGAVTWYSYQEVAANYNSVSWPTGNNTWNALPYAWSDAWENKLDLTHIRQPTVENGPWQNPFVYWGADNYAVIRWDSIDETHIALTIFEWLGSWVEVSIEDSMEFIVSSTDTYSVKLITGQGKFILCRLGIKGSATEGLITLFHRDPYLPGVWHSTYQLTDSSDTFQVVDESDLPTNYQQLEMSIGTNIAAVLDKSAQKLYLYSLINNQWSAYPSGAISFSGWPGAAIQGDEVFAIAAECTSAEEGDYSYQLSYTLYKFDLTQLADKVWQSSSNSNSVETKSSVKLEGINISSMEGGVFLVQLLGAESSSEADYTMYPMALSWNTDSAYPSNWQVNLQKINNTGIFNTNNVTGWGFGAQSEKILWVPSYYGSIFASNLINIIPEESGDNILTRNVTRYAGGNTSIGSIGASNPQNIGWIGDSNFNMLSNNTDPWPQMAIFDNVVENVAIKGSDDNFNYKFYQYTPYANSTTSGHPYWMAQSNVGEAMGQFTDWENIEVTVSEVLTLAGDIIKGVTRWLPDGREVAIVVNKLTRMTEKILKDIAKKAMSGRCEIVSQGMNYLIVGRGGYKKYNTITGIDSDDPPVEADYDTYQPFAFAKVWDTQNACWTWNSLDAMATLAQNNTNITWSWTPGMGEDNPPGLTYDNFIIPFLGQEIYNYGNTFIPFSYIKYGGRELDKTTAHDSFYRAIYFDQVAFFQNGAVCNVQLLPTWQTTPESYTDEGSSVLIYSVKSLPYLIFTGADKNPPLMSAPWGGILGYFPESMNFYYDPGKKETTDWAWQSNQSSIYADSSSAPPTPQLSLATDLMLALALNNAVSGDVTDYVVSQVAVDDCYQTYNTFFQYMPWYAAGQSNGSVIYNQVRTAVGSMDYEASALANGWTEYYFYNGGINYQGSPTNKILPYDPASGSDNFCKANEALVNAGEYYNLMTERLYCQRTLISQNPTDFSQGYEVARQQVFYQGFEKYVLYDANDNPATQQTVTGVLPTVSASYTAPSNTTYPNITDAYAAGTATLNAVYNFYDLDFIDLSGDKINLYGPWNPADSTSFYALWLLNNTVPLRTALPLGKLIYNYNQSTNSGPANVEGFYTQNLPGLIPLVQGNNAYQQFVNLNIYSTVQTITWYHPNVPTVQGMPFSNPAVTWGNNNNANWQVINSTVNAWQEFVDDNSNPLCWYPLGQYAWQGNQGIPQTTPWECTADTSGFQWSNTQANLTNAYWVQQSSSPLQVTANGVVLTMLSNTNVPSFTVYDIYQKLTLAQFTNAGSAQENLAFYLGFEAYENVSPWTVVSLVDTSLVFSSVSYTGNRSLLVDSNAAATGQVTLSNCFSSITMDSRNWLFSCSVLFAAVSENGGTFTLTISANDAAEPVASVDYDLPLQGSWTNYRLPINFATCSPLTSLIITLSMQSRGASGEKPVFYVDNVYLVPAEAASFNFQTYDSAKRLPVASASQADANFSTRILYNNLQQKIGMVQKANQFLLNGSQIQGNQAVSIALTANYFSRNGYNNQNNFSATDPNSQLTVSAGTNHITAGYYFDFRDGQNPWQGGQVSLQARALLLAANESASYPIPTDCSWGFGLRVQLQAQASTSSDLPSAAMTLLDTAKNSLLAINWDGTTRQYSLTGSLISKAPAPIQVSQAIGDWMLILVGTTLYFYADGQQIFSQVLSITDLPQGDFVLEAGDSALSCGDIIILQDPSMDITYSDGAGKTRQTQSVAQVTSLSS
jgi:hypothetical protein